MNRRGLLKALVAVPVAGLAAKTVAAQPPKPEPPKVTLAMPETPPDSPFPLGMQAIDTHGNWYSWQQAHADVRRGELVECGPLIGIATKTMLKGECGWVQTYGLGVTWGEPHEVHDPTPKQRKIRRKK